MSLGAYLFVSLVAWAEDKDHHLFRDLVFEREVHGMDYVGMGLFGSLPLNSRLTLSLSLDHQNLKGGSGDTATIHMLSGERMTYPQTAGIGHRNTSLLFSVAIAF